MKVTNWRQPVGEAMSELFPATRVVADWKRDGIEKYCSRCGARVGPHLQGNKRCAFCKSQSVPWGRIVRLSAYEQPMEDWIRAMKFARAWAWAPWFGGELAASVRELGSVDGEQVVVCPVPMHWSRRYNQAQLMAGKLTEQLGVPMAHLLTRKTATPPQTVIPHAKRRANVRGCFSPKAIDLGGWRVLLVDDVKTSGATLGECVKVLRGMGARDVDVLVAAVADTAGSYFTRVYRENEYFLAESLD